MPQAANLSRRGILLLGLAGAVRLAAARLLPPPPSQALFDFAIAGAAYHGLAQALPHLREGQPLDVRPEPANPHDPNAVAIHMPQNGPLPGLRLGYLPRAANPAPATLLARGALLQATVRGRLTATLPPDLAFTTLTVGEPLLRLSRVG